MRCSYLLHPLALAGHVSADNGPATVEKKIISTIEPSINKFIIEIAEGIDYDDAVADIAARDGVKILRKLRTPLFNGISIEAVNEAEDTLMQSDTVAQAWRSHKIQLMPNIEMSHFSGGLEVTNYSVHSMTGVDKLHAQGILGKGAKIAVVDTGVDYMHPAVSIQETRYRSAADKMMHKLGSGFGPGFKIVGGYDFVGDGLWPNGEKKPDEDPMDQMGHGTHVTGIIAGKSDWYTGVAPEASILSYKVFTEADYTDEDTIIEAFLRAYQDGADIITASIGEISGWGTGAWATISSRLVEEGIIVTIAAGNSGEQGPFTASDGSSGKNVLAIASVDPATVLAIPAVANFVREDETQSVQIGYRPGPLQMPTTYTSASIYPLSLNSSVIDDACSPLPEDIPNLSDKLVLVRLSLECWDYEQAENIAPYSPLGIVFYHDDANTYVDPTAFVPLPLAMVTSDVGEEMVRVIANGGSVTMDFSPLDGFVNFPYIGGGAPSYYTSWGGTWDLEMKPEIAAPGSVITSTYPTWLGSWATLSGTSMATPYVAGIAALYISKHGGRDVYGRDFAMMLNGRIQGSGGSLVWPGNIDDSGQHLTSPLQVGAGLINAYKVLEYKSQLSFTKFHLNDTNHFSRYQGLDITNTGNEEVTYTFSVEDAAGFDALYTESHAAPGFNTIRGTRAYKLKPTVHFPAGTVSVKPGEKKHVEFIFEMPTLPEGREGKNLPLMSGKILIWGSNGEQLSVPYFGIVGDVTHEIREHRIFRTGLNWPQMITGSGWGPVPTVWEKPYWGFNLNATAVDYPMLEASFLYGASELRWDIFEPGWEEHNWRYPPVVGENGYIGSATYWRESQRMGFEYGQDNADDVLPMPAKFLPRDWLRAFMWFGKLANGTQIPPGNYTMRVAALLPFGNRVASDDWDIMELPEIMILPYDG